MIAERLKEFTPAWTKKLLPQTVKDKMLGTTHVARRRLRSMDRLASLMLRYQVKDLVNADPKSFRAKIDEFLNMEDAKMEGYGDASKQRDLSIKFHWAHHHDFGDFVIPGMLGTRHVSLIAILIDWFPVLPPSLEGLRILDVGCWTGGTSLLLSAMGAHVVAVEEVKKYIDCLNYLKFAFNIERLEPRNLSLYECTAQDLQDSFDYVLFAGVLYHVTDPILALRITYNCLKNGATCIIETAVKHSREQILRYDGPRVSFAGTVADRNRSGWNWFSPSPSTLSQMMTDVGFTDVRLSPVLETSAGRRIFAAGRRDQHRDLLRGGLSVRNIR